MNAEFGRNCRIRPVQSFAGRYTRRFEEERQKLLAAYDYID
jgi:hypothetical protein